MIPDAVREVYNVAPPGSHGEQLRAIVVNIAAKCGKNLLGKGKKFCAMMEEVAEFGKEAFQIMAAGQSPYLPLPRLKWLYSDVQFVNSNSSQMFRG